MPKFEQEQFAFFKELNFPISEYENFQIFRNSIIILNKQLSKTPLHRRNNKQYRTILMFKKKKEIFSLLPIGSNNQVNPPLITNRRPEFHTHKKSIHTIPPRNHPTNLPGNLFAFLT